MHVRRFHLRIAIAIVLWVNNNTPRPELLKVIGPSSDTILICA